MQNGYTFRLFDSSTTHSIYSLVFAHRTEPTDPVSIKYDNRITAPINLGKSNGCNEVKRFNVEWGRYLSHPPEGLILFQGEPPSLSLLFTGSSRN